MNKDRLNEIFSVTLGSLSVIAIIALLIQTDFDTTEILNAIINFSQVAIPILVLLVATTIKNDAVSLKQLADSELYKLQMKYKDILMGPCSHTKKKKPQETTEDLADSEHEDEKLYLFVTNEDETKKTRAKLISFQDLEVYSLIFYVQKVTLVYSLNYPSADATPQEIDKIKKALNHSVSDFLENKYSGCYDISNDNKNSTAAINIKFFRDKISKKKFVKAITQCVEKAALCLKEFRR